jgi:acyl-CoA thioesterase-1
VGGRLGLLLTGMLLTACSASGINGTPSSSPSPTAAPHSVSIVALGDSVPRGTNCDCTPYPELTAGDLSAPPARKVTATNDSVAGYTTEGVLRQLTSNQGVIKDVSGADTIEIEVGANDVAQSSTCGTSLDCYTRDVPPMEKNLRAIVAHVHELTAGHPVLVVLLDYWSVWLGGAYAAEQGEAYVATVQKLTDDVNAAVKSVAADSGSAYVDLRAAFKGPDYSYDETHYLSDDGDHPNASGHQRIAAAIVDVIDSTTHP